MLVAGKIKKDKKDKDKGDALNGVKLGDVVEGIVDGVELFGIFIEFWVKKRSMKALCHISEVSHYHALRST